MTFTSILPNFLAVFSLLLLVSAGPTRIQFYHRVVHPDKQPMNFVEFGSVVLPESSYLRAGTQPTAEVKFSPHILVPDDFDDFVKAWDPYDANGMYQVAMQRPWDKKESQWSISVVKTCHLVESTSAAIIINLTPAGDPFTANYFASPVPQDGSCPSRPEETISNGKSNIQYPISSNTTIILRTANTASLPQLKNPPQLSAKGEPVQPIQEKSFLQKYWVYIAIGLGALLLSGGAEDRPQGGGGGSGGR